MRIIYLEKYILKRYLLLISAILILAFVHPLLHKYYESSLTNGIIVIKSLKVEFVSSHWADGVEPFSLFSKIMPINLRLNITVIIWLKHSL